MAESGNVYPCVMTAMVLICWTEATQPVESYVLRRREDPGRYVGERAPAIYPCIGLIKLRTGP